MVPGNNDDDYHHRLHETHQSLSCLHDRKVYTFCSGTGHVMVPFKTSQMEILMIDSSYISIYIQIHIPTYISVAVLLWGLFEKFSLCCKHLCKYFWYCYRRFKIKRQTELIEFMGHRRLGNESITFECARPHITLPIYIWNKNFDFVYLDLKQFHSDFK